MAIWAGVAMLATSGPAAAKPGVKASFIDGTYATAHECRKARKIEAGGPKNVATAPELLTADGIQGWENWCSFEAIARNSDRYTGKMSCGEGAQEWTDTYTFKRRGADAIDVTNKGQTTRYQRCEPAAKR
jgi:hypothetical protein